MASDSTTLAQWWGRLCGGQIVSATSFSTMTDFPRPGRYGLGIADMSPEHGPSAVGNQGLHVGFTSLAACLPEQGAVVVVLANDEGAELSSVVEALVQAGSSP